MNTEAGSRCEDDTVYESLIAVLSDANGFVRATPRAHVGSNQLWTSCCKAVDSGWLVVIRFASFVIMATFLSWDTVQWDASIFVYYTEWQVPVCALIIVAPSVLALHVISKVKTDPLFLNDLWKPQWRKLNPCWLLFYRAFAFICMSRILFEVVVLEGGAFAFYFYTQWTFALVMIYFALGTVFSAYGCWVCLNTPLPENGDRDVFLRGDVEENGRYAQDEFQQSAYANYISGAVILTDIVFWCVLVPFLSKSSLGLNMLMGSMHSLNAVSLILDTLLNSLWSCLYVVFQWVLHASGFTWWPYPFLELNTPWAPLWYFALALVHIPCYGMYALIVKAKNSILPKLFPRAFSGLPTVIGTCVPRAFLVSASSATIAAAASARLNPMSSSLRRLYSELTSFCLISYSLILYARMMITKSLVVQALGDYTRNINDLSLFPSQARVGRTGSYWHHDDTQAFFNDVDYYKVIKAMSRLSCNVCDRSQDRVKRRGNFRNIEHLKGHLFHMHRLVMCSLCLQGRKVFISEQKLFSGAQLNRHINTGNSEVDGTDPQSIIHVIYAKGTEVFLVANTSISRVSSRGRCRVFGYFRFTVIEAGSYCGRRGFMVKWNPEKCLLQIHFRQDHYLCEHEACLAKMFIVFWSVAELKRHNTIEHGGRTSPAQRNDAFQDSSTSQAWLATGSRPMEASSSSSQTTNIADSSSVVTEIFCAGIAQLGERQTEDLKVACSIHAHRIIAFLFFTFSPSLEWANNNGQSAALFLIPKSFIQSKTIVFIVLYGFHKPSRSKIIPQNVMFSVGKGQALTASLAFMSTWSNHSLNIKNHEYKASLSLMGLFLALIGDVSAHHVASLKASRCLHKSVELPPPPYEIYPMDQVASVLVMRIPPLCFNELQNFFALSGDDNQKAALTDDDIATSIRSIFNLIFIWLQGVPGVYRGFDQMLAARDTTFHFPSEEAAITLEDVAYQLGVPINGALMVAQNMYDPTMLIYQVFEKLPPSDVMRGYRMMRTWLEFEFQVTGDSTDAKVNTSRAFLLDSSDFM
ncbi:hypothetical protein F3Y22_tig00005459pilonHSYRG00292 [Hibiscus syriacus]|uniref:Uncharacterized protein n=1 Tax=Hibiscus syriacus TaxID=106335 RepID=A0A6A3CKE8_HIBSY|nr:hypothetical protein F3Y22_tig00005459pilonHSYRG00292 [Hibiscus syriacus]